MALATAPFGSLMSRLVVVSGLAVVAALAGPMGQEPLAPSAAQFVERPCDVVASDPHVRCGVVAVPEDRAMPSGRRLALNVLIIAARSARPEADPILVLHGGPGGAATRLYPGIATALSPLGERRDIVLVDVRGTGASNPLDCLAVSPDEQIQAAVLGFPDALLQRCLSRLEANPRRYTTSDIIDDLDDVRGALGYSRLNLIGFSYGTRAALAFMRRYPSRVRSAVLHGAADIDSALPSGIAAAAQSVVDALQAACDRGTPCGPGRRNLRSNIEQVLAALERSPRRVRVSSPAGPAGNVAFTLSRDVAAGGVVMMLYSQSGRELLPVVTFRAARGDVEPFAQAIWDATNALFHEVSVGLFLSVTCSEDAPRVAAAGARRNATPTFQGEAMVRHHQAACAVWPRGQIPADVAEPSAVATPTLILSGALDPVTPPSDGEAIARRIGGVHVVLPNEGHEFLYGPCARAMVQATIERGAPPIPPPECAAPL